MEYLYFKLANNKVQINRKKNKQTTKATSSSNAKSHRKNVICLINDNQQKLRINKEGK